VLQRVAVCCSGLQCVTVGCSVFSTLQCVAATTERLVLASQSANGVAVCCSVLQLGAVRCSVLQCIEGVAGCCRVLQGVATASERFVLASQSLIVLAACCSEV